MKMSDISISVVICVELSLSGVSGSSAWPVWITIYAKVYYEIMFRLLW